MRRVAIVHVHETPRQYVNTAKQRLIGGGGSGERERYKLLTEVVEQTRRRPIKDENPDVLDVAFRFVTGGLGCVIHVRDSSTLREEQAAVKVLVTPRECDRYSITVGVEMSIRTKRYRVTGMRNAEVVAVGLCICRVGSTTGKLTDSGRRRHLRATVSVC